MANSAQTNKIKTPNLKKARGQILDWYDANRRELPWRHYGDETPDPYKVWLSEIMLQQTTVAAVKAYYAKFLSIWPTLEDLASASQEQVLHEWAGLGYYSRARNLLACAQTVVKELDGVFPDSQNDLKKLPGIGDYTSAAITTIAFGKPATVLDGNIERITSRLFRIATPLPKAKKEMKTAIAEAYEGDRPGDIAQALMDIGNTICTPKNPKCMLCPISKECQAFKTGDQESYPVKPTKKTKPKKVGYAYWIENQEGKVLMQRRPEKGLLAGTLGFPVSEWTESTPEHIAQNVIDIDYSIFHSFTHFDLELKLFTAQSAAIDGTIWLNKTAGEFNGLPSIFSKLYKAFKNTVK